MYNFHLCFYVIIQPFIPVGRTDIDLQQQTFFYATHLPRHEPIRQELQRVQLDRIFVFLGRIFLVNEAVHQVACVLYSYISIP